MTGHDVVFVLVGLLTAAAAFRVVTSTNLMHAALYLAVTLAGIGGVFLVLAADFLALVQLVVYVGAVAVLFLFGLMLTRAPIGREALDSQNRGLGIAVAGALFVVLTILIVGAFGDVRTAAVTGPGITSIGLSIFRDWVLPFEVLSMLLLAALIGAIVLSRREAGESGQEAAVTHIEFGADPDGQPREVEGETGVGDRELMSGPTGGGEGER